MKIKLAKIKNLVYEKDNYINTNYTGLAKLIYFFNHKLLELGFSKKIYNKHIIEIGGGAQPHIHYMDIKNISSYTIVDSIKYKKNILLLKKKYKNIKFNFLDYRKKIKKKNYTRLIASHTFEHMNNFEKDFINLMKCLNRRSLISIALPCDPGILWRLLQLIYYYKQKKNYGWRSMREKDLSHARDHCTPVQNITKILNYYFFNIKKFYFPFLVPSINLNIFLILQLKLKNIVLK